MALALKKALFLDRDGVINEDVGYPHLPEQIVFKPDIFDFCKAVESMGYLLIVVTNQAGVAKGYFTEEDVQALHIWMGEQFRIHGITITRFYYCPYHPKAVFPRYLTGAEDRKPKPGMILKAAREFNLDLSRSVMVGDKGSDRIEHPLLHSYIIKSDYTPAGYDIESLAQLQPLLSREG